MMSIRLLTMLVFFSTATLATTLLTNAQDLRLRLVGTYRPGDQPGAFVSNVAVSGDYAYTSVMNENNWQTTLRVVRVADRSAPVEVGLYSPWNHIADLVVDGSYAYIVFGFQGQGFGLQIIDISNPITPTRVGTFTLSEDLSAVAVAYPHAYVGSSTAFRIIDVTDPTKPVLLSTYATAYPVTDIAIAGSYAYVAGGETGGLRVIDVADPRNPTELGFSDTPGDALAVAIAGPYAYVADKQKGLRIVNVSTPSAPAEVSGYDLSWALGVAVSGDYALVSDYYDGLHVVNVADPAKPVQVAYYLTRADQVAVAGSYVYVTTVVGGYGMPILTLDPPVLDLRRQGFLPALSK